MQDSIPTLVLNEGQEAASEGFFEFLMNPNQKELHITGPGGVGKTFTMSHMIDSIIPRYVETCELLGTKPLYDSVVMTATTNKASAVLADATQRPTLTVHSFFNLTIKDNFKTGTQDLIRKNTWTIHKNKIIFIDESSMIDFNLLKHIREGTLNCKIVFISDHCQLPPVKEVRSPVYNGELTMHELTQPMRNADQPALMELCTQVRNTVLNGKFEPIRIVPGVVDLLNDEQMETQIQSDFINQNIASRILCYTNKRVTMYNDYIRELRQLGSVFTVGEVLVNNSATNIGKQQMIAVEEEVEIIKVSDKTHYIEFDPENGIRFEVKLYGLQSSFDVYDDVPVPLDRSYHEKLIKWYANNKDWAKYFELKNNYPDLRPRDACTVHKSQGSSYDTAYIDLTDISTCRDPALAARLLYVAVSRARNRIIFHGELAEKFGGLILPEGV